MPDGENNKLKKFRRYVSYKDWEAWLLKEWYPFKNNDLPHLKRDVAWIKYLLGGMIIALITAAFAILARGN